MTSRDRFEEWIKSSEDYRQGDLDAEDYDNQPYKNQEVDMDWSAWQACDASLKIDIDRLKQQNAELLETMSQIIAADKTYYEYTGRHSESAAGDKPKAGRRWATPRELAQAAIAKAGEVK